LFRSEGEICLRSLTSVRDDNPVFSRYTVSNWSGVSLAGQLHGNAVALLQVEKSSAGSCGSRYPPMNVTEIFALEVSAGGKNRAASFRPSKQGACASRNPKPLLSPPLAQFSISWCRTLGPPMR
jgi:hypothetical protein